MKRISTVAFPRVLRFNLFTRSPHSAFAYKSEILFSREPGEFNENSSYVFYQRESPNGGLRDPLTNILIKRTSYIASLTQLRRVGSSAREYRGSSKSQTERIKRDWLHLQLRPANPHDRTRNVDILILTKVDGARAGEIESSINPGVRVISFFRARLRIDVASITSITSKQVEQSI